MDVDHNHASPMIPQIARWISHDQPHVACREPGESGEVCTQHLVLCKARTKWVRKNYT